MDATVARNADPASMSDQSAQHLSNQPARRRLAVLLSMVLLWYVVVLGGTSVGELNPWLRLVNALVSFTLIAIYVVRLPHRADRLDRGVVAAILLFSLAGVLSVFPRQSFDAVLSALTYGAALFVAREVTAIAGTGRLLVWMLRALSIFITALVTSAWIPLFIEWWVLTDTVPPLDLNLSAAPWGHRHDLTLLVVMLYPSWWTGRLRPYVLGIGLLVGIAAFAIVIIDGSRTLWLGLAVATVSVVAPRAYRMVRARPVSLFVLGTGLTVAGGLFLLSGFGGSLLERLLTTNTLAARSTMWSALTEAWLSRPLSGLGPGSFPWVLQQTKYFETNTWAPRHPDSVIFQLLPEAGLLGIMALVCMLVVALPAVMRAPASARWSLVAFAVVGIGANPTDFAFLLATALAWMAYAVPHESFPAAPRPAAGPVRVAALGAIAAIAVIYAGTVGGGFAYAAAAGAGANGEYARAHRYLDLAVKLDPGMSLYQRQRGTVQLLIGDPESAIPDLMSSTRINPSDDLAWRTLALAYEAVGDTEQAVAAVDGALRVQRSDLTNLLLAIRLQLTLGDRTAALATAAEVVQGWPTVLAAQSWQPFIAPELTNGEVVSKAIARWTSGRPAPSPFSTQALWLSILGGRDDLLPEAKRAADMSESLTDATLAVLTCSDDAAELLRNAPQGDRRVAGYWGLRAYESARAGAVHVRSVRIFQIMTGNAWRRPSANEKLNPLAENGAGGFSADSWGYRRPSIDWPSYGPDLPSPNLEAAIQIGCAD